MVVDAKVYLFYERAFCSSGVVSCYIPSPIVVSVRIVGSTLRLDVPRPEHIVVLFSTGGGLSLVVSSQYLLLCTSLQAKRCRQ